MVLIHTTIYKMKAFNKILFLFFLLHIGLAVSETVTIRDSLGKDISFKVDDSQNSITINFNGKEKLYKDVIGTEGQIYKDFMIFNNQPTLWYSNTASRFKFDVYYTLQVNQDDVTIDCAYADIMDSSSGLSINKAICGLNKKLDSYYPDLIYLFSNKWIDSITQQKGITLPINIKIGKIGSLVITARYLTQESLDS